MKCRNIIVSGLCVLKPDPFTSLYDSETEKVRRWHVQFITCPLEWYSISAMWLCIGPGSTNWRKHHYVLNNTNSIVKWDSNYILVRVYKSDMLLVHDTSKGDSTANVTNIFHKSYSRMNLWKTILLLSTFSIWISNAQFQLIYLQYNAFNLNVATIWLTLFDFRYIRRTVA